MQQGRFHVLLRNIFLYIGGERCVLFGALMHSHRLVNTRPRDL